MSKTVPYDTNDINDTNDTNDTKPLTKTTILIL